jgi:hypothetical protein
LNGTAVETAEDEEVYMHLNLFDVAMMYLCNLAAVQQMEDEGSASDDFLEPNNRNDSGQVRLRCKMRVKKN